jgi:hypothetical protein
MTRQLRTIFVLPDYVTGQLRAIFLPDYMIRQLRTICFPTWLYDKKITHYICPT